ncbi:MAG: MoxR family ATPase [Acidobacteriota bacterium]|nr:MoxR family ATPase [Acidobacteriota bacterium]
MKDVTPTGHASIQKSVDAMLGSQKRIVQELRKVIVGQDNVIEQVLIALYVGGHCLITGFPGLAKTLLVRSISQTLGLTFKRIQFTPDLMPTDITGTEIIEEDPTTGRRELEFVKGPIFANVILADEINRTPPKTQAALLEAMQERKVTVRGVTYDLDAPFFVLATQNPIELEGTYLLPEAQLDRFMFNIFIDYLPEDQEVQVVQKTTGETPDKIEQAVSGEAILDYQKLLKKIPANEEIVNYAVRIVGASRPGDNSTSDFVKDWVRYGASLRASQFMVLGGKVRALLHGRFTVSVQDIQALAKPVLRHRILTNFNAESEGITPDDIIEKLLELVPAPQSGL